jgi:hypothetical protein
MSEYSPELGSSPTVLGSHLEVRETEDQQTEVGAAILPALEVSTESDSFRDCFIDDIIDCHLDTPRNRERAAHIVQLAVHVMSRPHAGDELEPVPRRPLLGPDKLEAEGRSAERQIVLGWEIRTREFKVALPYDKQQVPTHQIDPWVLEVLDTVAAFLNADPRTKMDINVPEAVVALGLMTQEEADRILYCLRKTMYGNVDAALRYFLKFELIVLEMGLKQCKSDPCILYQENNTGELCLMIAVHVDDSLTAGRNSEVTRFMDEFEKHLKIEWLGPLTKHLAVWWEFCTDQEGEIFLKASMEKMRHEIIEDFEKATGNPVQEFATPGYHPGTTSRDNFGDLQG